MEEYEQVPKSQKTEIQTNSVSISTFIVLLFFSILTWILIIGNLLIGCLTNFSCFKFLPSPGYLGCFRGHDRLFIVGCTLYGFILPLFYSSAYTNFRPRLSELKKKMFIFLSICSSISLPILSLSDEVIDVHVLPVSFIYNFSSSTFVVSNLILTVLAYLELRNFYSALNDKEKKWYRFLQVVIFLIFFLVTLDFLQWKYSTSSIRNQILSENGQSVTEWCLVTIGIFLPVIFSLFFRDSNLHFALKSEVVKEDDTFDIELSEVNS
ncbi:hypothetical protein SteCoe_33233 [Stentor coeruleus]|uniref:Uncharacterized protein n=1 Tax=Stentor coeruleus TaxID=5963 RepID=A0A1R2AXA3_9CILI|nr:hypothetical protein SteCoe_33233 [Stentor coeruleus]